MDARPARPLHRREFMCLAALTAVAAQSTPQKILAEGTDWRFLDELKKELKG